jgi:hypothetical protein
MRWRPVTVSALAVLTAVGFSSSLLAQNAAPPTAAAVSNTSNATKDPSSARDFSGVWTQDRMSNSLTEKGTEAPLTAWGKAQLSANQPAHGNDQTLASTDPVHNCFPPGIPRLYFEPFPMEIMQAPGRVVVVFEYDHFVRYINTDGRQHPADLSATWMGNAIGHWDGDTLVVDTIGFNDKTWLDRVGHPHSDALHLIERLRRTDHDTLVDDITIDDSKAYTKPWTAQRVFKLKPKWEIIEFVCEDTYLNFNDYQKKTVGGPVK